MNKFEPAKKEYTYCTHVEEFGTWLTPQTTGGGEGGTPTAPESDDPFYLILTFASIKLVICLHPNACTVEISIIPVPVI